MDAHALRVLDYFVIIEKLVELCQTLYGREIAEKLTPSNKIEEIQRALGETSEAREWLDKFGDFTWGHSQDLRPLIAKGKINGILTPEELLQIKE